MKDKEYIISMGIKPEDVKPEVLEHMQKWGENRWWLSEDHKLQAYYQLQEDYLLLPNFSTFHTYVEELLGRSVWTHEFGLNRDGLIAEAMSIMEGTNTHTQKQSEPAGIASIKIADKPTLILNMSDITPEEAVKSLVEFMQEQGLIEDEEEVQECEGTEEGQPD